MLLTIHFRGKTYKNAISKAVLLLEYPHIFPTFTPACRSVWVCETYVVQQFTLNDSLPIFIGSLPNEQQSRQYVYYTACSIIINLCTMCTIQHYLMSLCMLYNVHDCVTQ